MHKIKIIFVISIFSILISVTSLIKNQTRILEKKISKIEKKILISKKDLHETELDYFYLTTPYYLTKKIKNLSIIDYLPMDISRIYFNYEDFKNDQKKITILKRDNEKTKKK